MAIRAGRKGSAPLAVAPFARTGAELAAASKGARTRRNILRVTEELLATTPVWDLRTADISRGAQIAPATFYSYFDSVSSAVLAVALEVAQSTPRLIAMLAAPWSSNAQAEDFVNAYVRHWNRHRALFTVRNAAADGGDARFDEARFRSIEPLFNALVDRIADNQRRGIVPDDLDPSASAGIVLAMLERSASIATKVRRRGVTRAGLLHAAQHMVFILLGRHEETGENVASGADQKR